MQVVKKELLKAAFAAKRLGITLDDTKGISSNLLNFESSIAAELEAELLTGTDLNFEKARSLALQGKSAEAADAAFEQAKKLTKEQRKNPLIMESMAKAAGMTTDQLAEAMQREEQLNKLVDSGKYNRAEAVALKEQELAASAKLATSIENIKSSFTSFISGPLSFAMEKITGALNFISSSPLLKGLLSGVGTIAGVIAAAGSLYLVGKGLVNMVKGKPSGRIGDPLHVVSEGGGMGSGGDGGGGYMPGEGRGKNRNRRRTPSNAARQRYQQRYGKRAANRRFNRKPSRGRRGRGLGGALATGLSYLAPEIISSVTGGGDGGSALGDAAMMAGTDIAAEGAGSLLSRAGSSISGGFGKIGNLFSKGASAVGNFAKNINPIEALKSKIPTIGKNFGRFAKRIPVIGTLIEGLFTASDIASIAAAGGSKDDIYQDIGRRTLQGIGGIAGGIGAAAITTGLSATGIPAFILNGVAYTLGDMAGRWLFGQIADVVGAKPIGEAISKTFGLESKIESANQKSPKMMATGGMVTQPINAIVGEAGPEAVIPLNEFYRKFDELISAVKAGGDVYMDSTKVGTSMAVGTYKVQ